VTQHWQLRLRAYPNTPLWFDLLLATGVIALAHGLDEVIRPPRRAPRFEEAFPPEANEEHDDHLNLRKGRHGQTPFARAAPPTANAS